MGKASLLKRFLAYLLDAVIASVPVVLVGCVFAAGAQAVSRGGGGIVVGLLGLLYLVAFLWNVVYFLFRDWFGGGRSFGKAALGLDIRVLEGGERVGILKSLLRNVVFLIPFVFFVEVVMVFVDPNGQRLGDKLAKTQVVNA